METEHLFKNLEGAQSSADGFHSSPFFADTTVFSGACEERRSAYLPSDKCHLHNVSARVAVLIDLFTESNSRGQKKRGVEEEEEEAVNAKLMSYYFSSYPCLFWAQSDGQMSDWWAGCGMGR